MDLVEFYEAFFTLSPSRQVGQGIVGPIPLEAMLAYFQTFNITDEDERRRFIDLIQALDQVYITWSRKKLKEEQKKMERTAHSAAKQPSPRKR